MKIVVHAGMHKTGSSAIQTTLAGLDHPGFAYAPGKGANHSGLYHLLFLPEDQLHRHRFHWIGGQPLDDLRKLRDTQRRTLTEAIERCTAPVFVISAERISAPEPDLQHALATYLRRFSDDIDVIAYVRPPVSYLGSAFQQIVRARAASRFETLLQWPEYQKRFASLDAAFGPERVTLVPFRPDALTGGDAVTDFADRIGIDLPPGIETRRNASLGQIATAALFVQRDLGSGPLGGYSGANRDNNAFVNALRPLDGGPMRLSPRLVGPMLERHRDDIAWIEARLGQPIADPHRAAEDGIAEPADLHAMALAHHDELRAIVARRCDTPPPRLRAGTPALDRLVADLDHLKHSVRQDARPGAQGR